MGIRFLKQSSASSFGYTENVAKDTADPSLRFLCIFAGYGGGWAMAAVCYYHPGHCDTAKHLRRRET